MRWTDKLRSDRFKQFRAKLQGTAGRSELNADFEPVVNYDEIGKPVSVTVGRESGAAFKGSLGLTTGTLTTEITIPWSRLDFVPNRADKRAAARTPAARKLRHQIRSQQTVAMRKTFRGITTQDQADTLLEAGLARR